MDRFSAIVQHQCSNKGPYENMKITITIILILGLISLSFSQSIDEIKEDLKAIETIDQIALLNEKYYSFNVQVIEISEDSEEMSENLLKLKKRETTATEENGYTFVYKLIEKSMLPEYRASYIYLDGTKLSAQQIDSLRPLIINKFKSGTAFSELVDKYNMDGNADKGDLGWFKQGSMMPEFESAVRDQTINEIFTVDVPERNWHYVALKTHENREKEYWTFVKVRILK